MTAATLARPPSPSLHTWTDAWNAVTIALCDPLFDGDPARLDDGFRRLLDAGGPPPDRVVRLGGSIVLSWRGGRTAVLGD